MNFCTEQLGTRIQVVDRVSEEGYEVSNLLKSNKFSVQSLKVSFDEAERGFMASRFVRPPIKIRLDFPIPIHISHIVMVPKLGRQVSSGFKLEVDINSEGTNEGNTLYQISREFINGPDVPEVVVFRNPRFVLNRKYCKLPLAKFECHRNFPTAFGLRHPTYNSCERVFSLHLTIERAEAPARIPVLGGLEIWGQPSKWSPFSEVDRLVNIWKNSLNLERNADTHENHEPQEPKQKRLKMSDSEVPTTGIPDDFLDPITFEVLCQPMRLPCGIAIDIKTLERYTKEEFKWGRCENDPFTGKPFTDDSRPLPDAALKARIDSFLTQHSSQADVPRTLGSKPKETSITEPRSSRITQLPKQVHSSPATSVCLPKIPNGVEGSAGVQLTSREFMDQELARILGHGSSFKPQEDHASLAQCFNCFQRLNTSANEPQTRSFYKSSCDHIIVCRNCIIELKRSEPRTCLICNSLWSPKTVVKICI